MGFFAGMTSGIYRRTIDGRRIYQLPSIGPRRRWPAYLVSDEDTKRVETRLRRVFQVGFLAVIPLMVLAMPREAPIWYWLGAAVVPSIVTRVLQRLWVLRGIPRVVVDDSELEPIDRRAREMAHLRAMGTPVLVTLIVAGAAMTTLQVVVLILDRYWWAGPGTVLFAGSTIFLAHRLFLLRRARALLAVLALAAAASRSIPAQTAAPYDCSKIHPAGSCSADGIVSVQVIDDLRILIAIDTQGVQTPDGFVDHLFLYTASEPHAFQAGAQPFFGHIEFSPGALRVVGKDGHMPLLFLVGPASATSAVGLDKGTERRFEHSIGLSRYTGWRGLRIEHLKTARRSASCDGPPGACVEGDGFRIRFPA